MVSELIAYVPGSCSWHWFLAHPNREDEPEYIVRLVGRVMTMKLVDELA